MLLLLLLHVRPVAAAETGLVLGVGREPSSDASDAHLLYAPVDLSEGPAVVGWRPEHGLVLEADVVPADDGRGGLAFGIFPAARTDSDRSSHSHLWEIEKGKEVGY